jgi:hypothetical protein
VRSHEKELNQARAAFRQALQDAIEAAKGTLTIQQGQILREHLNRQSGRFDARLEGRTRMERRRPAARSRQPSGECLTGRLDESMDQLRKRVGDMLDRFGLDGQTLESWKREWQDRIVCPPMTDDRNRPQTQALERPRLDVPLNAGRLRGLMMDHLDTLERVLREKLSAVGSSQA